GGDHAERTGPSFFAQSHQLADFLWRPWAGSHLLNVGKGAPRPKGIELLRLIHTLHERSFAGRVRKAAEVAAQPLPRRNELTLLAFLNSPDTYRVDLVGHRSCSLLSRHRRGSAAHRLPVWYERTRGARESLLAAQARDPTRGCCMARRFRLCQGALTVDTCQG